MKPGLVFFSNPPKLSDKLSSQPKRGLISASAFFSIRELKEMADMQKAKIISQPHNMSHIAKLTPHPFHDTDLKFQNPRCYLREPLLHVS